MSTSPPVLSEHLEADKRGRRQFGEKGDRDDLAERRAAQDSLSVATAFGCSSTTTETHAPTTVTAAAPTVSASTTIAPLPEPVVYTEACRLLGGNCDDVLGQMPDAMLRPITRPSISAGESCQVSPVSAIPTVAGFGPWTFDSGTAVGLVSAPPPERVSLGYRGDAHPVGQWTVKALWHATPRTTDRS